VSERLSVRGVHSLSLCQYDVLVLSHSLTRRRIQLFVTRYAYTQPSTALPAVAVSATRIHVVVDFSLKQAGED